MTELTGQLPFGQTEDRVGVGGRDMSLAAGEAGNNSLARSQGGKENGTI